jgi:hypothetical protein
MGRAQANDVIISRLHATASKEGAR